jgi:hypothetical protein
MKLKIIIFPFVLIMTIIMSVNFIYPDFQKILASQTEIKNKEASLTDLEQKSQNVKKLVSDLESNGTKKDFVLSYLPEKKNEEVIVDRANYLTVETSTLLVNADIKKSEVAVEPQVSPEEQQIADNNAVFTGAKNQTQIQSEPPVSVSLLDSSIELIGTYENIKNYLNRLYRIEDWYDIKSLEIMKNDVAVTEQGNQGSNEVKNLVVKYDLNFGYLPKMGLKINQVPKIFAQSKFDYAPADKAMELCTSTVPDIDIGSYGGRIDPFFP